jgi:hypothetical protein
MDDLVIYFIRIFTITALGYMLFKILFREDDE